MVILCAQGFSTCKAKMFQIHKKSFHTMDHAWHESRLLLLFLLNILDTVCIVLWCKAVMSLKLNVNFFIQ